MTKLCIMCKKPNYDIRGKTCGWECAKAWLDTDKGKAKTKATSERLEKKRNRARKEKVKGAPHWVRETRKVAQEYAALRDMDKHCISCGVGFYDQNDAHLTRWDGGHFKTVGAHPELQLNLNNLHGQCRNCNGFRAGNIEGQKRGIVARFGQARLDWLQAHHEPITYTIEYLKRYRRVIRKRMRRFRQ